MLNREDCIKVIYDSPTPCMWASFIKNENEMQHGGAIAENAA